jgi:hypothetical protein
MQGNAMLAVVRHFGNLQLEPTRGEDTTTFTPFGWALLSYPSRLTLPLAVLAVLITLTVTAYGLRRARLSARLTGLALVGLFSLAVAVAGAGHLVWQIVLATHPESQVFGEADFYGQSWFVGALLAAALALGSALWPGLARRVGEANLALAGALATALLALVIALTQPWLAYLEIWPAIAAALGLGVLLTTTGRSWQRLAVLVLVVVPAAALPISGLYLSIVSGVQGSPALVLGLLVLLLGLLTPQVILAGSFAPRLLPVAFGAVAIGILSVGINASAYSAAQPRPDTAAYLLNTATGRAFWATADGQLDAYTGQLLLSPAPRPLDELIGAGGSGQLVTSRAPVADLPAPSLTVRVQQVEGDVWTLAVHLESPRGGWRAAVFPRDARLREASFEDAPPLALDDELSIIGLPAEGVDFVLKVQATGRPTLVVVDTTIGLPEFADVPSRPVTFMTAPVPDDLRGYPTFVAAQVSVP